jgi:hypothetical protein
MSLFATLATTLLTDVGDEIAVTGIAEPAE